MQKQKKQLIFVSLVLVVLLAVWAIATWLPPFSQTDETTADSTQEADPVIQISAAEVKQIEIINKSGRIVLLPEIVKTEPENSTGTDGTEATGEELIWNVEGDAAVNYDRQRLSELAIKMLNLTALREIETVTKDPGRYGLDQDSAAFIVTSKDGSKYEIQIGDELASETGTYAALKNSGRICSISTDLANELHEDALYWMDKTLPVGIAYNDLTDFSMIRNRDNLDLKVKCEYNGDPEEPDKKSLSFEIVNPVKKEGGTSRLGTLVSQITDMKVEEFVELEPADLSEYGLEKPEYLFTLTTMDETLVVSIGSMADSDSVYVMTNRLDAVMTVPLFELNSLDAPLIELVDSFVSLHNISRVEKIVAEINDTEFVAEINVKDGMPASDESSTFILDGRDARIFSQNNENLFINLFQSLVHITVEGMDPVANPVNTSDAKLVFYLGADTESGESARIETVEFAHRDDYTDYVFIDGSYTGFYIDSAEAFSSDMVDGNGIIAAYNKMVYAIDNAVDGIFNTEEGYQLD